MKKIITLISIFILSIKMTGQNLDDLYANATLNSDFTSTLSVSNKETILKEEFTKWFINNKSKFNFENGTNIIWNKKWYWGSTKTLFQSITFIKPENVNQRIAYLEAVREANERNRSLSWEEKLHEFNEILKIPEIQSAGKYIGKKINNGIDSFKENMRNSTSTDSSNNSSPSNDNNKIDKSEDYKSTDNKHEKSDIEFREDETRNCGDNVKITDYKVYKNGEKYSTISVSSYNGYWSTSCPNGGFFTDKAEQSRITLKQFLIRQYESGTSNADSYTLTTK